MKVSAIFGSPRKSGVTSSLAATFMKQAQKKGADTQLFFLNQMSFKGCQGCGACKTHKESCALNDDATQALESLQQSDIIVFATPVYFWDVTGQFKMFFDRTWSLVKPDYKTNPDPVRLDKGKKALLITSQGDVKEKHGDVYEKYAGFLTMYGFDTRTLRAVEMGDEYEDDLGKYQEMAKEIAQQMLTE